MRRLQLMGVVLFLSLLGGSLGLYAQNNPRNILRDRSGQKWALLIGVEDYTEVPPLDFCGQDMRDLRERLLEAGFPHSHVFLLHDKATSNKGRPFKPNIERALDQLLGKVEDKDKPPSKGLVEEGDLVVIAFSGHGVQLNGSSYLCPAETQLEKPETLVPLESIYSRLSACPASHKLLLVDACRNDPHRRGQKGAGLSDATKGFARSLEKPREGILLLASCKPAEVSWEDPDLGHGVFMHFIMKGLAGEAKDRDGEVTALGLYKYASKATRLHVAQMKNSPVQTPQLYYGSEDDFVIGSVGAAGEVVAAGAPSFTNGLKMKMVRIEAGKFTMGPGDGEKVLNAEGSSPHEVEISQPYYLAATPVTVGQFSKFVRESTYTPEVDKEGAGGSGYNTELGKIEGPKPEYKWWRTGWAQTDNHPVVNVTWNDAVAFCHWLSKVDKREYRLPTEAEWEYACRAGTKTHYWNGDGDDSLQGIANIADRSFQNKFKNVGWGEDWDDGYPFTAPVGKFKANPWGLYDMHGNVWQWCQDWYGPYQAGGFQKDPQGPGNGEQRVLRGGAFDSAPVACRAASRLKRVPNRSECAIGFRVVALAPRTP